MDFKKYLLDSANSLDQEIEQILTDFLHQVEKLNVKLTPFALGLISSCKGGKRIRGTLVKMGYELADGHAGLSRIDSGVAYASQNDILKIGAAYEILHGAILIHDDIIDQSELRRGKQTLYKALGGPARNASPARKDVALSGEQSEAGGDHYGISQAIGLGDIGLFLSIKLIADSNFLGEYKNKALSHFAQTVINTGWGQVLDVELPHLRKGTGYRVQGTGENGQDEKDVIAIHSLKTAQYTISGTMQIGAILAGAESDSAGADEELLRVLGVFGENLGIAFQIQDDILGVFGDEGELGKSVSSDIMEGKNTLLIVEALKRADIKQREVLDKYYGKGKIGDKELEQIREIFKKSGALDYSRAKALEYVTYAKGVIPKITDEPKMKKLLEEMAEYLVERSK